MTDATAERLNPRQVRVERSRSRHPAPSRAEPLADRLRRRGRLSPARARHQLGGRGDRRRARRRLRARLGQGRDPRGPRRGPEIEPETRAVADVAAASTATPEAPLPAYTRSRFLEATALGLGAAIGAVATVPVLGFMVLPSFTNVEEDDVDLGPLDNFPEGDYVIATYLANPSQARSAGERCSCGTTARRRRASRASRSLQQVRAPRLPGPAERADRRGGAAGGRGRRRAAPGARAVVRVPVSRRPVQLGGQLTAGPPVRSLDRYTFSIRDGRLVLGEPVRGRQRKRDGRERDHLPVSVVRAGYPRRRARGVALPDRSEPGDG